MIISIDALNASSDGFPRRFGKKKCATFDLLIKIFSYYIIGQKFTNSQKTTSALKFEDKFDGYFLVYSADYRSI